MDLTFTLEAIDKSGLAARRSFPPQAYLLSTAGGPKEYGGVRWRFTYIL